MCTGRQIIMGTCVFMEANKEIPDIMLFLYSPFTTLDQSNPFGDGDLHYIFFTSVMKEHLGVG